MKIKNDFGIDKIFQITGKKLEGYFTLPKLMWLRDEENEIWDKTYKFLMPMDYLIAKFTGNCVTDHSMASGTLLYDLKTCRWSQEILDKFEISEEKLPKILWSGENAGTVLPEIAKELGLTQDCVVAVGAQDQKCAALGAGLKDGTMTISLSTAGAITKRWDKVDYTESNKVG